MREWLKYIPKWTLALVVLHAATARAQTPEDLERAKQLYTSATKHYNLGEFADAVQDFKEAYRRKPDPAFLYDIGQAYRQLGDPDNAAQFYRAYLREMRDLAPARKAAVEKFIADAQAAIQARDAARPPTAVEPPAGGFPGLLRPEAAAKAVAPAPPIEAKPAPVPVYKKWWLWTTVGAVVAGGAAATVVLVPIATRPEDPILGTLAPGASRIE